MSQTVLKELLNGTISETDLYNWLLCDNCDEITSSFTSSNFIYSKSEFVSYYLSFLRSQTERLLNPQPQIESGIPYPKDGIAQEIQIHESTPQKSLGSQPFNKNTIRSENECNKSKYFTNNSSNFDSSHVEQTLSPVNYSAQTRRDNTFSSIHSSTPTDTNKNNSTNYKSSNKFQRSGERISLNFGDYVQNHSNRKKSYINKSRGSDVSSELCDSGHSLSSNKSFNQVFDNKTPDCNISEEDFPALGSNTKNNTQRVNLQSSRTNRNKRIKPTSLNFNEIDKGIGNVSLNRSFNKTNESLQDERNNTSGNNFQSERSMLINERDFIKKQFENAKHIKPIYIQPKVNNTEINMLEMGDIQKVTNKDQLDTLINIYSFLLNNNLLINFVGEVSFTFSLLNVENTENLSTDCRNELDLLTTIHNCIYFATKIIEKQKKFLVLLDTDTIRVLSDNKRVQTFNQNLHSYLKNILEQKRNCYSVIQNNSLHKNNVCFQSDTDNRENFTSDQTFRVFRKQRDIFYDILRNWQSCRHKPNYLFSMYDPMIMTLFNTNGGLIHNKGHNVRRNNDIGHNEKVTCANDARTEFGRVNIFYNNVCNMAHFARLFVKQLVASCESEHTEYNQQVLESLPNVDPTKLSRLSSRFVMNTSVTHDITAFTGVQEFYRDFIAHCDNHTFLEHLKIVFCYEILDLNAVCLEFNSEDVIGKRRKSDVVMTSIEIAQSDANTEEQFQRGLELIKKVSSLRLLAKFLGFVTDLPYNNNGNKMKATIGTDLEKIEIHPRLNLKQILSTSEDLFNTFVIAQWITMYLSMLNEVTLAMPNYKILIEMLFEIYAKTITSTRYILHEEEDSSVFFKYCLKSLLGYFFDLPNVPTNFLEWRFSNFGNKIQLPQRQNKDNSEVIMYEKKNNERFDHIPLRIKILEEMLYQNMPILSSLRSIIKGFETFNKGRVRHVTPFTHESSSLEIENKRIQVQLETHFFNNQPSSVRKTVEFVADRIFSVVVKEIVAKEIARAKISVAQKFADINSTVKSEIETQLLAMCMESLKDLMQKCNSLAELISNERINTALTCLFPVEMLDSIKSMCTKICHRKVKLKYQAWFKDNVTDTKLLCKDLDTQVGQILNKNILNKPQANAALEKNKILSQSDDIVSDCEPGPSTILIDLQDTLSSVLSEELMADNTVNKICCIFENIEQCAPCWNALLNIFLKTMASLTVDLVLALVCHYPNCLKLVLPKIMDVWRMEIFDKHTKQEEDTELNDSQMDDMLDRSDVLSSSAIQRQDDNFIFIRLMSARNILMISNSFNVDMSWNSFTYLLSSLLIENFLTLDCFSQQSCQLLRTEWSSETMKNLSTCINSTLARVRDVRPVECSEVTLLLEWMAEFCDEIDDF